MTKQSLYLRTGMTPRLTGLRLFFCAACDHHLRFGRSRCSVCYEPTPLLNRLSVVAAIGMVVLLVVFVGVVIAFG
jgi:hypothetical protein